MHEGLVSSHLAVVSLYCASVSLFNSVWASLLKAPGTKERGDYTRTLTLRCLHLKQPVRDLV